MHNSTAHLAIYFTLTSKARPSRKCSTPYHHGPPGKILAPSESMSKLSWKVQEMPVFEIRLLQTPPFQICVKEDILKTIVLISAAASQFTERRWLNWTLVMRDANSNERRKHQDNWINFLLCTTPNPTVTINSEKNPSPNRFNMIIHAWCERGQKTLKTDVIFWNETALSS